MSCGLGIIETPYHHHHHHNHLHHRERSRVFSTATYFCVFVHIILDFTRINIIINNNKFIAVPYHHISIFLLPKISVPEKFNSKMCWRSRGTFLTAKNPNFSYHFCDKYTFHMNISFSFQPIYENRCFNEWKCTKMTFAGFIFKQDIERTHRSCHWYELYIYYSSIDKWKKKKKKITIIFFTLNYFEYFNLNWKYFGIYYKMSKKKITIRYCYDTFVYT